MTRKRAHKATHKANRKRAATVAAASVLLALTVTALGASTSAYAAAGDKKVEVIK
ncbi:hypothetical protein [Streptomyces sp. NPDC059957]|uniref:hypothetical protein n=1 Tax=unclassified Streptomyces TaxID=2593676 RepID=UPI003669BE05